MSWDNEDTVFRVVMNHEEQYSIWPDYLDVPLGWREVGKSGKKKECLDFIEEHWTDMRPLSLRRFMEEQALQGERGAARDGAALTGGERGREG